MHRPVLVMVVIQCFAFALILVAASPSHAIIHEDILTGNEPALLELKNSIQLVREQLTAMIDHRQQDYNALEESLKRSMEKNTELTVLKNQVRQLRYLFLTKLLFFFQFPVFLYLFFSYIFECLFVPS